jgi:hypothetical protein
MAILAFEKYASATRYRDENGNNVSLKLGARVEVTVEAKAQKKATCFGSFPIYGSNPL